MAKRLKLRFYRASVKEDLNVNEGGLRTTGLNVYKSTSPVLGVTVVTFLPLLSF